MSKIDLLNLLNHIEDYVLIKKSDEFPEYLVGGDIDLIVFDIDKAKTSISSFYGSFIGNAGEMRVTEEKNFCHIDFLFDGKLDVRLDLIDSFNFFKKFEVKNGFIVKLFKDHQIIKFGESQVYVPCDEDDLMLRYFEYLEYFDNHSAKIKHLDYICSVNDDELKKRFFENTHCFINFKRKLWKGPDGNGKPKTWKDAIENIKLNFIFLVREVIHRLEPR